MCVISTREDTEHFYTLENLFSYFSQLLFLICPFTTSDILLLSLHVILFSSVVNSLLLLYVCVVDTCAWVLQTWVRGQLYGVSSI